MKENLELTIGSSPSYEPMPQSPPISPDGPALNLSALPAVSQTGEATIALFASLLLPHRLAEIYGARASGATEIIAIDLGTGEVYHNEGQRGHAAPISAVMNPDPEPPKPGAAVVDSIEIYFALDLRAHLRLPARSALYSVFLWLDELTSAVRQVQLPGPNEKVAQVSANSNAIAFSPVIGKPTAEPEEIVLRESGGIFKGEIGSAVLSKIPSGRPTHLNLLALDYRSRTFNSVTVGLPLANGATSGLSFQFPRSTLFVGPGWLDASQGVRKVFVLAALGAVLSPVRVLTA